MKVTVTDGERELIRRMLQFANMKQIKSTRQVEALFRNIPGMTGLIMAYQRHEVPAARAERESVSAALRAIASGKKEGLIEAINKTNDMLQHVKGQFRLTEDGMLHLGGMLLGVQACAWYAVVLVIDKRRGLRTRLGFCDAPGCGKFNLTFEGRPRRYCDEKHRLAADSVRANKRVQKWRRWVREHGGKRKRELRR